MGRLTLDFSGLTIPRGQTFVRATVGMGDLHVVVPANATVDLDAHVQAGNVVALGRSDDGTHVHTTFVDRTGSGRVIVLDLHTGFGKITVDRG